jgi:hypothetical protein
MNSLWNKQKRSSKASDYISETLGTLFITPNVTRWNSFFNFAARCASFVVLKPTALKQVFSHFGVDYFRPAEEEFLLEYVKILRPIAEALDVLQADKNISIGYLLPTLTILKTKFRKIDERHPKHCQPMLREILKGIEKRFGSYFNDRELKLAAILHPRFKLHWLPDEQKASHEEFMRDEFNAEQDGKSLFYSTSFY